jgi:hypothetical protein
LRDRIGEDLKANFNERLIDCVSFDFAPDFIVRDGNRVAVIELKIGDPTFPLPASANVQMLNLKDGALKRGLSQRIVPVLVTNYQVDDADRRELESGGIRLFTIEGSNYNGKALSAQLNGIMAAAANEIPQDAPLANDTNATRAAI